MQKKGIILIITALIAILFLILLILMYSSSTPTLQIDQNDTLEQKLNSLDSWLSSLNRKGQFNGVVLVAKEGTPLFNKAYGHTDHTGTDTLDTHSSFNLASLSKQFTAIGILILENQGKLKPNDPVSKHIASFPYPDITIEHLVYHTSGLPDYMEYADQNWDQSKTFSNQDLLHWLKQSKPPLLFSPGDKHEYSNAGYAILASLIEEVSQQSFDEFVKENIFSPLDMDHSDIARSTNAVSGFSDNQHLNQSYLDGVAGDGNIYSSSKDILKWDQALYSDQLIPQSSIETIFQSGKLNNGQNINYGFGWNIENKDIASHEGEWLAFNTYIERNQAKKTLLFIADNSDNNYILKDNGIAHQISEQIFYDLK